MSVQQVISAVQTSLNDLLIHEQTPLSLAQQCSGLDNNQALFTALLNYRHSEKSSTEQITQALDLEMLAGQERTNYPFSLSVDDYGDDFYLAAQIDGDVDPNRVLAYLSQALDVLVDALMNDSEQAIRTLSILPVAERQQLLTEFNHTAVDYPAECCVHQLFEKQVAKTPDAIAVTFGGELADTELTYTELTYAELNRQANQVARYLIDECYVKPDNLIGLCVERSLDMIIGMLGILKAGGAYVPLDPNYPESRLAYMLDDASLSVLVTQTHLQTRLPNHSAKVVQLDSAEMQKQLSRYLLMA